MTARGARAVIQRLEKHGCIRREGGKRYIDDKRVVTQMPSCVYILSFRELCLATGRATSKDAFHRHLIKRHGAKFSKPETTFEKMYTHAVRAGYIREIETEPGTLEIGSTLEGHLAYLQLFRKRPRS
jgi:hypothetical protein